MRPHRNGPATTLPLVRCAVYTRKSTEEGLKQEFNTLDAQREAAEAFVASQRAEGWTCLPDRYDDGGFTGGNMDRPALQRLMADIAAGKVDCVVTYKVDRLSRSLLDFARMMAAFEQHKVAFVSVTQQFNTATSMGRLVLNVLLSFAQFEREIIGERTRDKIAATRRKGKWAGGHPVLGYDVDAHQKLQVNDAEAQRVKAIFELYRDERSLLPVVEELDRRGWTTKHWATRAGGTRGGRPFDRTNLYRLLTNVAYTGRVRYKDETHPGEHAPIIDDDLWNAVQQTLQHNGRTGGAGIRYTTGAILQGLLRCGSCDCAMTPSQTTKAKARQYRYYVCSKAQKNGWKSCPTKSVPAGPIERLVVEKLRAVGRDPAVLREALVQARTEHEARLAALDTERQLLERDLGRWHAELARLSRELGGASDKAGVVTRLAGLQDQIGSGEKRLAGVREQMHSVRDELLDEREAAETLAAFDPVWEALVPREQARLVHLLVERVVFDGSKGTMAVTFAASGIKTLADELADRQHQKERIA